MSWLTQTIEFIRKKFSTSQTPSRPGVPATIAPASEPQNEAKDAYKALEQLPHTYTGLLDDVMYKYAKNEINDEFFKKMIAKNIFF